MATHNSQDLDGTLRSLKHELREALRLGRDRVGVEHDVPGFAVVCEDAAAPASPDRDGGDVDIISDATFTDPGSLSEHDLRDLIDRFGAREHVVSYERRMLHGRMDLLRAELVGRLRLRYRTPDSGDAASTMS
jgi:hypothetical protein